MSGDGPGDDMSPARGDIRGNRPEVTIHPDATPRCPGTSTLTRLPSAADALASAPRLPRARTAPRRAVLALLIAGPAAAQDVAPPAEFTGLAGQPLAALAAHPAIGPRLRRMAAGRQRLVSETVRGAGPGITWEAGWLAGHAHTAEAHVLLGFAPASEQLALMLWDGNSPSLFIPPRYAPWPEGLRGALRRFNPALEAQMRFGT